MVSSDKWEETVFENLLRGDVIRFFEDDSNTPLEQNGSSVFVVVDKPHPVGDDGNCKVSVVPYQSREAANLPALGSCPYWENIVIKPYGADKLVQATGYCLECRYMEACLKARHSSAFVDQIRDALGLNEKWN